MASTSDAKPFDEVLKIAETAEILETATGKGRTSQAVVITANISRIQSFKRRREAQVKNSDHRTQNSSSESPSNTTSRRGSSRSDLNSVTKEDIENFLCH